MKYATDDVRHKTLQTRIDIGFKDSYTAWQNEPAEFTEHTLVINGHPVMEDWEDSYMKALANIATQNGGRVLEVGYGMGISARYIQQQKILEHIIIEANNDVYRELEKFATSSTIQVRPLHGFWQDTIKTLEDNSIDGILFDTYPLTEAEVHCNHFDFFNEAYRVLKSGGILTYYSDEISDFSDIHLKKLHAAGFAKIDKEICTLDTPEGCQYWQSKTMIAPKIYK